MKRAAPGLVTMFATLPARSCPHGKEVRIHTSSEVYNKHISLQWNNKPIFVENKQRISLPICRIPDRRDRFD